MGDCLEHIREKQDWDQKELRVLGVKDNAGCWTKLTSSQDFRLAVAMGNVPGWTIFRKFGVNTVIEAATDPEDISEVGGVLPLATDAWGTAPVVSIGSTSAADVGKQVLVIGNDIDNNEASQVITLGTARTALTTPLYRAWRALLLGDVAFEGDVLIYTGTGAVPALGDPEVRLYVSKDRNQSQHCVWTVPEKKVYILFNAKIGMLYSGSPGSGTQTVELQYQTRAYNGLWTTKQIVSLVNIGSSSLDVPVENFPPIPARADAKIIAQEVSATMGIWGEFSGFLVDEDQFHPDTLARIQQPGYT